MTRSPTTRSWPETSWLKLDDSSVASISKATRYECAYAAIREIAELGLLLHGYRTSKSQAGHHQTAIQCLAHTLDVDDKTIRVLDRLRKQRNDAGYEAEPVTDGELSECVHQARQLMPRIEQSLKVKGWI